MTKTNEQISATLPRLKHDKEINLAMAGRKTATDWKNRTMTWSDFLQRLSEPTRTQETAAEYKSLPKSEKDAVKDVGGYVGGFLKGGRRKADAVQSRSLLTLDADHLKMDLWESVPLLFEYAAAIYSTHSHTPENPRERLIIPLARPVTPDEYEPIARKVAAIFGMNLFDDTTYQASRLMYWPSCPRDGEYIFEYQDEVFLNPDTILAQYEDWTDISSWPTSERESAIKLHERKKAGDPTAKPGIIGAFCRVYDIATAIDTFLPDVYEPTRKADRYTFLVGSTSGGLVLYDNQFAYSNHATDPTGGKLTNAFDLVRIHKFGDQDEEAKAGTPSTRLPSFLAMDEFLSGDKSVSFELKKQALASADEDFAASLKDDSDTHWIAELRTTKAGKVMNNIYNLTLILANDPEFKDLLGFNEFNGTIEKVRKPSWETVFLKDFSDRDISEIRTMIDARYDCTFSSKNLDDAIVTEARRKTFNPVKEYIEKAQWDQVPRIGKLLMEYFGVPDEPPYTAEIMELFFAGAVSRIYQPGCKFDFVITLIGAQGIGKSTFFRKLAPEFFTDSLTSLDSKDDIQIISDNWLIELGELAAAKRTDITKQKNFLSRTEDVYRKPYEKNNIRMKRHCVFVATTNEYRPLKDETGGRRWLYAISDKDDRTKSVFDGSLEAVIAQLWAEGVHLYKSRYKYGNWLDLSEEAKKIARRKQNEAKADDPMRDDIALYLDIQIPDTFYEWGLSEREDYIQSKLRGEESIFKKEYEKLVPREKITSREIMQELFNIQVGSTDMRTVSISKKIGMIMNNSVPGWKGSTVRIPGNDKPIQGFKRVN